MKIPQAGGKLARVAKVVVGVEAKACKVNSVGTASSRGTAVPSAGLKSYADNVASQVMFRRIVAKAKVKAKAKVVHQAKVDKMIRRWHAKQSLNRHV